MCLSQPGLFHLAYCSPVPSMLSRKVGAPSFLLKISKYISNSEKTIELWMVSLKFSWGGRWWRRCWHCTWLRKLLRTSFFLSPSFTPYDNYHPLCVCFSLFLLFLCSPHRHTHTHTHTHTPPSPPPLLPTNLLGPLSHFWSMQPLPSPSLVSLASHICILIDHPGHICTHKTKIILSTHLYKEAEKSVKQ